MPKTPEELRIYHTQWYQANKERLLEKQQNLPEEKKEEIREKKLKYYYENKPRILARHKERSEELCLYNKEYHEKNKEFLNAKHCLWLKENDEHVRKYTKQYKYSHKEKQAIVSKNYQISHKEEISIKSKRRYAKNHETMLLKAKDYRKRNKETINSEMRIYNKKHPELGRLHASRRRAREQKLSDTFTDEQRQFMLEYWHYACAVCGNQDGFHWKVAYDHWIPLVSKECPGTVPTNMIPLCHGDGGCNNSKHCQLPHQWLVRRFGKRKAAKIESSVAMYFAIVRQQFPSQDTTSFL